MTDARPFTILITGANQGLGLECVRILAQRPNLHIYVGARSEEKASGAIESLRPVTHASTKLEAIVIEMTSDDSIEAAAKRVPILDVLVNNAGVVAQEASIESARASRAHLKEVYETNVFGVAALTMAMVPALQAAQKEGAKVAIVNVSSSVGSVTLMSDPHYEHSNIALLAYTSSKTALGGLTRHFSKALPGVRTVAVNPGYCATNLNAYSGYRTSQQGGRVIADAILDSNGPDVSFVEEGPTEGTLQTIPW